MALPHHEGVHPLRIRRCEDNGEIRRVAGGQDRRATRPRCIENDTAVVHPHFDGRCADGVIGESCPPLVEDDQAVVGRERLEPATPVRILPRELDVLGEDGNPEQVHRPVTDHLIRDQELIIASGVCDGGHVEPHAGSLGGRSSLAFLALAEATTRAISTKASVMARTQHVGRRMLSAKSNELRMDDD
jgi:hypothetical protein